MNEEDDIEIPEEIGETVVPGLSEAEYKKIRKEAIDRAKTTNHQWIMKGRGMIMCTSCDFPHATYVPMNKRLIGIDKSTGLPIFTDEITV